MIYRDEKRRVEGVWNKTNTWTAHRHAQIFAEGGLDELVRWLDATPAKWRAKASRDNDASGFWDLSVGYEGALRLAREGWNEGVAMMESKLSAIIPAVGTQPRWGYGVSGTSVSMSRFLSGHPKNMRTRRKREMGSAPVLHIVVNTAASCAVSADQMANYGVALVGLINRLEQTGKRVHLDVVNVGHFNGGGRGAYGWNIKRASQPLDLGAVAFSIAHPAAFRRIGFAMIERLPKEFQTHGYGHCADIDEADVIGTAKGAMLLDGVNHEPTRCNTPQDALRLAIEQINKAAVLAGHATLDDPMINAEDWLFDKAA